MMQFFNILWNNKKIMILRAIIVLFMYNYLGGPRHALVVYLGFTIWDMVAFVDYNSLNEKILCILLAIGMVMITVFAGIELEFALYVAVMMAFFGTINLVIRKISRIKF